MAFQSIPQSNFASGFGSSIGKGLSEQLPQQAERSVQSHKLQNLGEDFSKLSPVEQIAKLVAIPGMDAQKAIQFIPYIQESQARKALLERTEGAQKKGFAGTSRPATGMGYEERSQQPDYLVKPNQNQIDTEASRRLRDGESFNTAEAKAAAEKTLMTQYEADVSQEENRKAGKDLLNEFINETGTEISGETRKRFENQYTDLQAIGGKSRQQAAKEMNDKLLDFSKAQEELKSLASDYNFAKRRKPVQESIQQTRAQYDKLGILDQFEKDLQSIFDYTPEIASQFAYPRENVSDVNQEFKKLKSSAGFAAIPRSVPKDFVDYMINHWDPEIGIKGYARELELKGYDPTDFINKLKPYSGTGKFTERQERELIKPVSSRRTLGDVWLDTIETRKKV